MPPYEQLPTTLQPGESVNHAHHHEVLHRYYNAVGAKVPLDASGVNIPVAGAPLSTPIVNSILNPRADKFIWSEGSGLSNVMSLSNFYRESGNIQGVTTDATLPSGSYLWVRRVGSYEGSTIFLTSHGPTNTTITPAAHTRLAVPGDWYGIQFKARTTSADPSILPTVKIQWSFYNSSGTRIGNVNTLDTGQKLDKVWRVFRGNTSVAPANTAYIVVSLGLSMVGGAVGDENHVTEAIAVKNGVPPMWFSGNSLAARWSGTPDASESILSLSLIHI